MDFILAMSIKAFCAILIIVITNFSKAFTVYKLGDKSVKNMGYLTLNPKKHFEMLGFIFFVFFGYGWGNPVPSNVMYYQTKDKNKSILLSNIVPLIVSLLLAFISIAMQHVIIKSNVIGYSSLYSLFYTLNYLSINFFIFNLLPIYPLYGQDILQIILPSHISMWIYQNSKIIQLILLLFLLCGFLDPIFNILRGLILNVLLVPFKFIF
ncbi:MAG: site-2 protease family protein [bacterium]